MRARENLREGPSLRYVGKTDEHGRSYRRGNWRDQKDIASFYFTRFSKDATEEDLWHHFKKFGDVREIFISKKKNNLEGAKQKEDETAARRQLGQGRRQGSYAEVMLRNIPRVHKRRPSTYGSHNKPTSRSAVYLNKPLTGQKWLKEAWVGRLKNLAMFDRVEDELLWDIGAIVSAKYIRDNMVLLLGLTEDTTKRLMEEDSESGASVFHSLEKWHSRIRAGCRLTWVHYWGIPLVAWDTSHIQKIIASIGDFMNVDDDVDELRRLDRVRVLIKTPWTPQIDHNVNVHIQGKIFNIHITEESTTSSDICYCRRSRYLSSLEEIDFEYNEAETQTKISQQETESFCERQLQRASRDNAEVEMSGQTPSLESTLEPETVSNDTTLLPSGPRYSEDPKDKPATQKGHVSPRPKVSEDTSTTNQGNITNNLGMTTHDRKGPMHAKGNAQKGNKTNPVDNTLRLPKKGKNEVHAASGS
ncbi:hypothetical protein HKD37_20G055416 [Glycine soja]